MDLLRNVRWLLILFGVLIISTYPLFANFLVTPEVTLRLEIPSNLRSQLRFCKQNPIQVYGRNPIGSQNICVTVLEGEVTMESFFTEEMEETSETQWSFYDPLGKQIFPLVSWEGIEPMVFVSLVRSKRGQFGVQLQRKKDGAYFFYRTKLSNWVV
ncbi:hypothetical protein [Leptospira bouyouniensis]|uniref:Uncharacterized protein n=1 Tax=Leptospira bouyouniensis TaxID=2484911 RepID=A0ABY2KZU6_9LEPT|nr:hypothetical protein [Leptospira bouyouniensis]TGK46573.1 hypothetical protein EHQ10_14455 [Leptospira bouyouniensis]